MKDDDLNRLPTGVSLRGGVYQLRIGAPQDLRHKYGRANAWRGSLRTSDRATAIRMAHEKLAEFHAEFERQRREAKPQWTACSPKLAGVIAERVRHTILYGDDERRAAHEVLAAVPLTLEQLGIDGLSPDPSVRQEQIGDALHAFSAALANMVATGNFWLVKAYAKHETDDMGLPPVDWDGHGPELARVARALVGAYNDIAARQRGEVIETPEAPPIVETATVGAGETLRDLIADWKTRARAKANAVKRTEKALALFEDAVGILPINALTKATGAKFVSFLLDAKKRGFSDSTAANHAAAVNALMNVAVRIGKLDRNPFDLSFEIKDAEQREAWTAEELQAIFGSTLFTATAGYPVIRGVDPADATMVLRSLLWTGARVGELAQLEVADVVVRDGIDALHIHDRVGTVKTAASVRYVPIAKELIATGFLEFVAGRRRVGERWLFPTLNRGAITPGDAFGKWFARFRTSEGLPAGALNGSHRFRHLMRSTLAAMNVGVEIADTLTGHAATGSTGRTVYTTVPLSAVKEAVDRLKWPFVTNGHGVSLPQKISQNASSVIWSA